MNKAFYAIPLILVLFAGSCKKETVIVVDLGYDYFPVEIGKYVIYDVERIFVDDPVNVADTFHYQLKEIITEDYIDNEGNLAQRIERFERDNDTLPWVIADVWASNRLAASGQRVEENIRIIRMAFPVRDNLVWDANALNAELERPMKYEEIHAPRSVNGFQFDSTVMIVTTLEPNLVDTIIDTEIRARDIGVVYKNYVKTNTQIDGTTGNKLTMQVIDYGME